MRVAGLSTGDTALVTPRVRIGTCVGRLDVLFIVRVIARCISHFILFGKREVRLAAVGLWSEFSRS